jgi:nucleosome binding factor SPN SPT16 subunit
MLRANDAATRTNLQACAALNDSIFSWLVDHVEGIIDEEKPVTHSQIAQEINTVLAK